MARSPDEIAAELVETIRQQQDLVTQLPAEEQEIVNTALDGQDVYGIAQEHEITDEAVLDVLRRVAQQASSQTPTQQVETGGLGSDTEPGVTGGYGETAFGSIGNEPGEPIPEEPEDIDYDRYEEDESD